MEISARLCPSVTRPFIEKVPVPGHVHTNEFRTTSYFSE
jgi:hypothetical protein